MKKTFKISLFIIFNKCNFRSWKRESKSSWSWKGLVKGETNIGEAGIVMVGGNVYKVEVDIDINKVRVA